MTTDNWTRLDSAVSGHQMTHVIEIWEDGAPKNLDAFDVFARAKTATGTAYTPTVTKLTQTDRNIGRVQVLHSAAQLATAGDGYRFRVYVAATGGALSTAEPLKERKYKFDVEDATETETP